MVNPTPVLMLDGSLIGCNPLTDAGGRKVLNPDNPTLIADLAITWGRADVWTQPEPSVLTFVMWEANPTWLNRIVSQQALRRPVRITYQYGGASPGERIMFQGFTTNVDVQAESRRTTRGITPGWRVQVQASDRAGFIGQESWGQQVLPVETMQQRAVRIRNQAASTGIRQFYFEDGYKAGNVKSIDVSDEAVIDTMTAMYRSFADAWCYNPARNTVNRIPGGSNWADYFLRLGVSTGENAVRAYPPAWTDPAGTEDPIDTQPYKPGYIGACDVSGPIALSANTIQDITHITCHWYDAPNAKDWTTELVVKDQNPRARLEFDSWYNNGVYIDPILQDVKATVTKDGARPVHPQLTWDCAKSIDVPDWGTFESLSLPAQTVRMVTLAGSPFVSGLGQHPVWHPCGGEVAYSKGRWRFTVNLAPTTMPLPAGLVPMRFDTMPTSVKLGPTPGQWHIDKSLSIYDFNFVNNDANIYAYN